MKDFELNQYQLEETFEQSLYERVETIELPEEEDIVGFKLELEDE